MVQYTSELRSSVVQNSELLLHVLTAVKGKCMYVVFRSLIDMFFFNSSPPVHCRPRLQHPRQHSQMRKIPLRLLRQQLKFSNSLLWAFSAHFRQEPPGAALTVRAEELDGQSSRVQVRVLALQGLYCLAQHPVGPAKVGLLHVDDGLFSGSSQALQNKIRRLLKSCSI